MGDLPPIEQQAVADVAATETEMAAAVGLSADGAGTRRRTYGRRTKPRNSLRLLLFWFTSSISCMKDKTQKTIWRDAQSEAGIFQAHRC